MAAMDRTRMALEKARKQRARGKPVFFVQSMPAMNVNPAPIQYHQTRVIEVPAETLRANRVVAALDGDPTANIYRILRSQVLRRLADGGWSTLAICSAHQGEGKTLTAVNLAISLAIDVNQTVLLVDLDLRDPAVASTFGIVPDLGLDDFLRGRAELAQCLINPGIERFVFLPVRAPMDKSSEVLGSPAMARLAAELKNRYPNRIVIYDMPPVMATDDCLAFMPNVDAVLFVVAEGESSAADIRRSILLLKDSHVIGTVLNKSLDSKVKASG
jgi:Mrp family chromosome partitioning ATPase